MSEYYSLGNEERIRVLQLAVEAAKNDPDRNPEDIFKRFCEALEQKD